MCSGVHSLDFWERHDIAGLRAILMGAILLKDVNAKKIVTSHFGIVRTQYVNFRTQSQHRLAHMNDSLYVENTVLFIQNHTRQNRSHSTIFLAHRNTTLNEKRIFTTLRWCPQ